MNVLRIASRPFLHPKYHKTKMSFSPGVVGGSTVPHAKLTTVIPIDDLETKIFSGSETEKVLRRKLASLYRLVDLFHWSQSIYNHITVRIPSENHEILINPFGLFYNEVTASSLIKVNLEGDVLSNGSTNFGINQAGYVLHSAVHSARPEVACVIHLHHPSVVAVSAQRCGLLPISQEALIVGRVAYHDFCGILVNEAEKKSIVEDLGDNNIMILRNHGFVVCGISIEHALHLAYHLIIACETQIRCVPGGDDSRVIKTSDEAIEQVAKVVAIGGGGVNRQNGEVASKKWQIGELEWEAYMRNMDRMGYQTGHVYRT